MSRTKNKMPKKKWNGVKNINNSPVEITSAVSKDELVVVIHMKQ